MPRNSRETPQRSKFRLSTDNDEHGAASNSEGAAARCPASPTSTALIVHPLSMFASASSSPHYGVDGASLAAFHFQRQEMQRLLDRQQTQAAAGVTVPAAPVDDRPHRLFDYTCDENLRAILGFLDGRSLCAMRRTCRHLHKLGDDDVYWQRLCKAEWAISPDQLRQPPESYQALYQYACKSLRQLIRELFEEQCLASMQNSFRIPREAALSIARRTFVA